MHETLFSPSGVRLRKHSSRAGDSNWLLLPGGPGIGSESLQELADCLTVEGSIWLVDLPGDGSNPAPAGTTFVANWPHVVVEAARMLPNVILAGPSTGGRRLITRDIDKPTWRKFGKEMRLEVKSASYLSAQFCHVPGASHIPTYFSRQSGDCRALPC